MQKTVSQFLRQQIKPDSLIVVGVSGGPDSLALLHAICQVWPHPQIVVAHLDHQLRSGSAADAEFVRNISAEWGVGCVVQKKNVGQIAPHRSLEDVARQSRYAFFADVAKNYQSQHVIVAHHADDQAETMLMHLLRGAGLTGLQGMVPCAPYPLAEKADLLLLRPLLGVRRAEIEAYCDEHGLVPRHDPSNDETVYFRNQIRHELLPIMKSLSPQIEVRLGQLAQVVAADSELLATLETKTYVAIHKRAGDGWLQLDLAQWQALALGLKRRTLRLAVAEVLGGFEDIGFRPIDLARIIAERGEPSTHAPLPRDAILTVGYEHLTIAKAGVQVPFDAPQLPSPTPVPLEIPCELSLTGGWTLSAEWLPGLPPDADLVNQHPMTVYLQPADDNIVVRSRMAGERMQPLGMAGHSTKLKDVMINRKISAEQRPHWPLVAGPEHVYWIVGHIVDERVKVREPKNPVLYLTCWR